MLRSIMKRAMEWSESQSELGGRIRDDLRARKYQPLKL